jgi:hypothetical protein
MSPWSIIDGDNPEVVNDPPLPLLSVLESLKFSARCLKAGIMEQMISV